MNSYKSTRAGRSDGIVSRRVGYSHWVLIGALTLLSACGSGDSRDSSAAGSGGGITAANSNTAAGADNANTIASDLSGQLGSTVTKAGGVMELTISGLGGNNPQTEVKWITPPSGFGSPAIKTTANAIPLPNFIDVAPLVTSTIDIAGVRHIAASIKVRNAPSCGAPPVGGTCAPYATPRQNLTFLGVMQTTTINQTAVSRFKRFDGSDANPLLTTALLPAHGLNAFGSAVEPNLASLQVYRESELPTPDSGVQSVFPYGFVVRNINDGSRILPANPASGQYDGVVTFGFKIPLQPSPTDDPFKISMRFQTHDDTNLRVTQSTQEQSLEGDQAAGARAFALSGVDLAVLGGRVAQTTIGDPICRVRMAGPVEAPTAYLVNNAGATPSVMAAPMNLSFMNRNGELSIGFCENMKADSTIYVHGSQSGLRKLGTAYQFTKDGGDGTNRLNQLVMSVAAHRLYFPGEEVSFTATADNATVDGVPIAPFVGKFRVKGSSIGSTGAFGSPTLYGGSASPEALKLGDVNGDGSLDLIYTVGGGLDIRMSNGFGGFTVPNFIPITPGVPNQGIVGKKMAVGDLNGDGRLDVVTYGDVILFQGAVITVLFGDGIGGFTASGQPLGSQIGVQSIELADMNADGHLDIIANSALAFNIPTPPNNLHVFLNDGNGIFTFSYSGLSGSSATSLKIGDLNGDGRLDTVTAEFVAPGRVTVMLGSGTGGLGAAVSIPVGPNALSSIAMGDANGDGKLDIVAASSSGSTLSVLLGDGAGGFLTPTTFSAPPGVRRVELADVNGDGKLDIVSTSTGSNTFAVMLGNGAGSFAAATSYATGIDAFTPALGDLDGDGKLDVVTANMVTAGGGEGSIAVMFGL